MKKFVNKRLFFWAIILSILAGLEMPFNTMTYSYIFYLITKKNVNLIVPSILIIIIGYGILSTLTYLKSRIVNKNVYTINYNLKTNFIMSKMSSVTDDENDFESKNLSFFLNDLKLLEDNYWRQIFALLSSIIMTIGTFAYALYSNVYLTLIFLAFMIVPTLTPRLFSKSIQTRTTKWSKTNQTLSAVVQNLLHGSLLLKRYNSSNGFNSQLKDSVSKMEDSNANLKNQISLSDNTIGFLFDLFSYLPIGLGIYLTIIGKMTLAQFVAIQYSSSWTLNGFNSIVTGLNTINSTKEIRQKIASLGSTTDSVDLGTKLDTNDATVKDLNVEQVAFDYDKKNILKNVSFDIKQGEKILVRGKSGIGKSTLFKMILKELIPSSGKLTINGQTYSQNTAYDTFGIVGQTPIIFETSLKDNITLGRQNETDTDVIEALKKAGLDEYANKDSLKMIISENGHNFSGGQLKRIEIARALFFNRQILLIDEGTASLDPETAAEIHQSILKNEELTVIEVDHHIPDEIKKLYTRVYELTATGLVNQS